MITVTQIVTLAVPSILALVVPLRVLCWTTYVLNVINLVKNVMEYYPLIVFHAVPTISKVDKTVWHVIPVV